MTHGIRTSAGVVTSAAVVMVGTFSVFALLPVIDMKEMGVGLAVAVLIDATIIRAVLLPATMKLLGERNWYLPSWLGWLPRLEHERAHASRRAGNRADRLISLTPAAPRPARRRGRLDPHRKETHAHHTPSQPHRQSPRRDAGNEPAAHDSR